MKIRENRNLRYNKIPKMTESYDEINVSQPEHCILESFKRTDDRFELYFKNGAQASIFAKNIEGSKEMDLIEKRLPKFISKSYEEFLNADF